MFDAADLAVFVDADMPGYVSATVNGQRVNGLFRARYAETFGFVGGTQPGLRVHDSLAVLEGDSVLIGAAVYTVATIEPAEPGFNLLKLETV